MTLEELLGAYLPSDRRAALHAGADLPVRARGAVLLADISGFTPLTEALEGALGPRRGGEELTRHLNEVYGALIESVEGHGGSVIGFAGDAITCWFADDAGATATACALDLQRAVGRFAIVDTPAGPRSLAVKAATTSGIARRALAGDPSLHVLEVLSGTVVDRVALGEGLAQPGEVLAGEEVVAAAGKGLAVREWRERAGSRFAVVSAIHDAPDRATGAAASFIGLPEEHLRPWLLPSVYRRLKSGHGEFLAELRFAAALFLRFSGLEYETDDDANEKLDRYVRWVQLVLERCEGSLIQLTTGDKGSYLYAAFGAPVAHEDVTERAVAAALTLRDRPQELGFIRQAQIGISVGRMRTGAYGSTTRRTYGVLGDDTNVAARLMSRAKPGQILVTGRVAAALENRYRFHALGYVALKGKTASQPLFELLGKVDAGTRRARARLPMIGRDAEREQLAGLAGLLHGRISGGVLVITGEAGIGKSKMAGHLLDLCRAKQAPTITCMVATTSEIERATPYFPWRSVFSRLLRVDPTAQQDLLDQLEAILPAALHSRYPLLQPVLQLELPDTEVTAAMQGRARVEQTRRYFVQVLKALLGSAPALLVVEDVHWADSASTALLQAVRRELPSLLIALTARPVEPRPEHYAEVFDDPSTKVMRLERLQPDQVTRILADQLGTHGLPPDLAAVVEAKAEGNPFCASEIVRALRVAGFVEVAGQQCAVTRPLEDFEFPATVQGIVTRRIDLLPPLEQTALKVASVLGRNFPPSLLRDVFPLAVREEQLSACLTALTRADLLSAEADSTYSFTQALTHEVAYGLMLFEQRRHLHGLVAEHYDRATVGDSSSVALLAHHRLRALDPLDRSDPVALEKTVRALMHAGRVALEGGAMLEALPCFEQAKGLIAALPPSRERAETELHACQLLGVALVAVRGPTHPGVRAEFERAHALCRDLGHRAHLFEALFGIWYHYVTGCERVGTVEFARQLLDLARAERNPLMTALANHASGASAIASGDHHEGIEYMRRVLAIVGSSPMALGALSHARNPLVMTHCYLAWARWFIGLADTSLAEVERAIMIANGIPHPLTKVQAFCFGALVRRYRREPAPCKALVDRAEALVEQHGFPYWKGVVSALHGWLALTQGDPTRCIQELEVAMAREREVGVFPLSWVIAVADLIAAYTLVDRLDDARALLAESRRIAASKLIGFGVPELHRMAGRLEERTGDIGRAARAYACAAKAARAQGALALELRALVDLRRLQATHGLPFDLRLERLYLNMTQGLDTPDLLEAREVLGGIDCAPRPSSPDLDAARAYVLGRLGSELSDRLTYHRLEHTRDDVLPAALRLARLAHLDATETTLLATAALFHDAGFIEKRDGHEHAGARIAREVLPALGYGPAMVDEVVGMILATKLPQSPVGRLQELMADADLDVLGRDDFLSTNATLRAELEAHGAAFDDTAWYSQQLAFVEGHAYFSAAAAALRDDGKRRNADELRVRLAAAIERKALESER